MEAARVCVSCGRPVRPGRFTCVECGSVAVPASTPPAGATPSVAGWEPAPAPTVAPRDSAKTVVLSLVMVVCVLAVAVGGFFAWRRMSSYASVSKELRLYTSGKGENYDAGFYRVRLPHDYVVQKEVVYLAPGTIEFETAHASPGDSFVLVATGTMDGTTTSRVLNAADEVAGGLGEELGIVPSYGGSTHFVEWLGARGVDFSWFGQVEGRLVAFGSRLVLLMVAADDGAATGPSTS